MAVPTAAGLEYAAREFAALSRRKKIVYGVALALTLMLVWLEIQFDVIGRLLGR